MADTQLMPIPGQVDPVPVARDITPRADGRIDLMGLPKARIAGLAHVMLPQPTSRVQTPGRAAPTAIPELLRIMEAAGARRRGMYARIAGGAAMFGSVLPAEGLRLGERNIEAVRAALRAAALPLRAEDVGGTFGRSLYFQAADGRIMVRAVKRDDVIL